MTVAIPSDLTDVHQLAREYAAEWGVDEGTAYRRLRNWWNRGKIQRYKRPADGKVFISRADLARAIQIVPVDRSGDRSGDR